MSVREFVISDLHFNHANIIKYENRPFETVEEMNATMIKNWNNTVSKGDRVYILGDFVFGKQDYIEELLKSLNGYKILVMGNHDRRIHKKPKWWINRGFDEVYKYPIIKDELIVMQHEPTNSDKMIGSGYIYLYGHVHTKSSRETISEYSACVCVERWNYKPILLEKLIKRIQEVRAKNSL